MYENVYRLSYKVEIPVDHLGLPPIGEPHQLWLSCTVGKRKVLHRSPVSVRTSKHHKWRGHFDAPMPTDDVKRYGNVMIVKCIVEAQDWYGSAKAASVTIERAIMHVKMPATIKIWQPRYDDELGTDYSTQKNLGLKSMQSTFKLRPSIIPGPDILATKESHPEDESIGNESDASGPVRTSSLRSKVKRKPVPGESAAPASSTAQDSSVGHDPFLDQAQQHQTVSTEKPRRSSENGDESDDDSFIDASEGMHDLRLT